MRSRDELLGEIRRTLTELFAIDPEKITMDARVMEDLDLDSIDAIDLAVRIEEITGARLSEETLRSIRKVSDLVEILERKPAASETGLPRDATQTPATAHDP